MKVVGFDTKEIRRVAGVKDKSFIATIGVGIETENERELHKAYDDAIETTFNDFSKDRRRKTYKTLDLTRIFGSQNFLVVSENLLEKVMDHVSCAYVFTTIIPVSKYPFIYLYNNEPKVVRRKKVPTKEFLSGLNNGYPFLCNWRYDEAGFEADKYLLDNFTYKETNAWDKVSTLGSKILYRGDTCNPILAIADITVNFIDRKLYWKTINFSNMKKMFRDNKWPLKMLPLGARYFDAIKPRLRKNIDVGPYISHPVHFLIPEERPGTLDQKRHIRQLEISRFADHLVDQIWGTDGCWKIFDKNVDFNWFDPRTDILYYFGKTGQELAEYFEMMTKIKILNIRSI